VDRPLQRSPRDPGLLPCLLTERMAFQIILILDGSDRDAERRLGFLHGSVDADPTYGGCGSAPIRFRKRKCDRIIAKWGNS
jgi:hypothetical protein